MNRVEVVPVECMQDLSENLELGFVAHEHFPRFATSWSAEQACLPTSTIAIGMEVVKRFRSGANGGSFSDVQEIDIG
jgi:hypothetical protein